MGNRLVKFEFTPGENEQVEACIIIPKETRSIITGVVKNHKNHIIRDAVVKLFEVVPLHDRHSLKPIAHTFTDENGNFLFGPLHSEKHYVIKVWVNDIKIRETVITPEIREDSCDYENHSYNLKTQPKSLNTSSVDNESSYYDEDQ